MTLDTLRSRLLALGIPGLFLLAFLDSAGIPIPGGVDLAVMLLAWQRPGDAVLVAATATVGSVLGSLVLYRVARSQGSAALSRVPAEKQDRIKEQFRRNDILAVVVATLGPPPLPTKLFVLVAGVVRMDWRRFATAAFAGRLIRFLGEAYLAVRLGDRAEEVLSAHYPAIAAALAVAVVVALLLRRRRNAGRQQGRVEPDAGHPR
jgi:membrane protein YqaA with SNARE-associated domain